jgi:hypothetical protein
MELISLATHTLSRSDVQLSTEITSPLPLLSFVIDGNRHWSYEIEMTSPNTAGTQYTKGKAKNLLFRMESEKPVSTSERG